MQEIQASKQASKQASTYPKHYLLPSQKPSISLEGYR